MEPLNPPPPIRRIDPAAARAGQPSVIRSPAGESAAALPDPLEAIPTLPAVQPEAEVTGGLERMRCERVTISYASKIAVNAVDLPIAQGEVLALIGPSGCGKTTLLRSLNRLTELTPTAARGGRITLDGQDIDELEVTRLRRRVSMVFQQPNPFPMSIYDNVAYALREHGEKRRRRPRRAELEPQVIEALTRAGLVDEVGQDLNHPALRLSGGQQQRLCIARSLAARPEVLLLDEPCSALDPRSTAVIEELITRLKQDVAVVIVTHNLQQARRIADRVAFMYLGELVEYGTARQMFAAPRAQRTRDYVAGAFG
jgi:phosphate transport system ATP-binding protein